MQNYQKNKILNVRNFYHNILIHLYNKNHSISSSSLIFGARKYLTLPSFSILYSTTIGVSDISFKVTVGLKVAALLKIFKYLNANEDVTGSSTSKIVFGPDSSSDIVYEAFIVIDPPAISPYTENLTDSFDVSIVTKKFK